MNIKDLEDVSNQSQNLPSGTDTHSYSVAGLSYVLSRLLQLPIKESIVISLAASTHDIGKKDTPLYVLEKNGKLTEEEFSIMKEHTSNGKKFLENYEKQLDKYYELFIDVAHNHHETIDGKGYYGLTGNEVSLPANLVSFTDIFDALRAERSYKQSKTFEETKNIMQGMESKFHQEIYSVGMQNFEKLNQVFEWFQNNPCHNKFIDSLTKMLKDTGFDKELGTLHRKDLSNIFKVSDDDFEPPEGSSTGSKNSISNKLKL